MYDGQVFKNEIENYFRKIRGKNMTMKFRAHDTFFIRKGWLSKGMKYVHNKPTVFIDKLENPMDVLGIGSNMVKALRYWLQAVGLTQESASGRRIQSFTQLGESVFKCDRFIEEIGTLHLLHYKLVSNKTEATAWYYFFNEFSMSEFSREDFVSSIQNYIMMQEGENAVAIRSLNDDFTCIINTYLPKQKAGTIKDNPENNIDCPFGDLGFIDIVNKNKHTYKKVISTSANIDPWIALAVITDQAEGKKEISLNELLTAPCNIGKIFNLDAITMIDLLRNVERLGEIKIIRTAGLDIIRINSEKTFQDCVNAYYSELNA